MPDLLARLYDLPDPTSYYRRAEETGAAIRCAEPWERSQFRAFIGSEFSER